MSNFARCLRPLALLSLSAFTMSACSWLGVGGEEGWLRDRQGEYLRAEITPPLQIPPELDSFTIDELYYIPALAEGDRETYIVPPAPKPMDTRVREGVVIQRFGDRAWIVIGATPGQVWPPLRDYWSTEQIGLVMEDAVEGVMETAWITQEDGTRSKYRTAIEPGLHAGNSEVYVRHITDTGETPEGQAVAWSTELISTEPEVARLASISQYLADRTDIYRASSVSLLAGSIEGQGKARVVSAGAGNTYLELRLDVDRAWSQVNQALNNGNISILSAERDDAVFQVTFSGQESADRPGFFGRLFRRGSQEEQAADFNISLSEVSGSIQVKADTVSGEAEPYLQDLLIRTLNENLI